MATDADGPAEVTASEDEVLPEAKSSDAESESSVHDASADSDPDGPATVKTPASRLRLVTVLGLVATVGSGALAAWLGFTSYRQDQAQQRRDLFLQVGRQGAINLTTIDWEHAESDVKRVLDSSTGTFYDDFAKRQQPFIEVVKKAQATSKGTITDAGLESESGDEAQVLVAVSVKTSNIGAAEQEPRAWRMRISVQKLGDQAKVSNVAFVP